MPHFCSSKICRSVPSSTILLDIFFGFVAGLPFRLWRREGRVCGTRHVQLHRGVIFFYFLFFYSASSLFRSSFKHFQQKSTPIFFIGPHFFSVRWDIPSNCTLPLCIEEDECQHGGICILPKFCLCNGWLGSKCEV